MDKQVTFVTVAGYEIPAHLVICPECNVLDLGTVFDFIGQIYDGRISCMCSKRHRWEFQLPKEATN